MFEHLELNSTKVVFFLIINKTKLYFPPTNFHYYTHPSSLLVRLADKSETPREKSEMMGDEGPQLDMALMLILLAMLDWPLQPMLSRSYI